MKVWWPLGVGLALLSAGWAVPGNLVTNPGLEEAAGDNGLPAGWFLVAADGSTWKASVTTPGRDSGHSLTLQGKGEWAVVGTGKVPLEANQLYAAAGWAKFAGTGGAAVKFDYFDGDTWLGQTVQDVKEGPAWVATGLLDKRGEFPKANGIGLSLVVHGEGQGWFDDLSLVAIPKAANEGNLLPNGLFENGSELPTGWGLAKPENEKPVATWTSDAAHSGVYGLRLKCDQQYFVAYSEGLPLDRAKVYTLTGWVRVRSGQATLKFDFLKPDAWLGDQPADAIDKIGEWTKIELTLDPNKFADAVTIAAAAVVSGEGSEADFDDLVVTAKAK